ncbi:hypothetical protein U0070_005766 [Myodes glareolus]|uniref:Ig-like domain-containing protein n=1 Tax=Myodes glareolus TaxID=447135 RepID=A0AAW0H7D2_MYOGA
MPNSTITLLEQQPSWGLVRRGQAVTLRCILKNSQYPWMSWYQQDLQQQLQWLFSLGSSGDKEAKSLPGADYLATRVTDTELRLQVANMTQSRTLYCTCSTDTVPYSNLTSGSYELRASTFGLPLVSLEDALYPLTLLFLILLDGGSKCGHPRRQLRKLSNTVPVESSVRFDEEQLRNIC